MMILSCNDPISQLPDLPIWPLLLILLTTFALMSIIALTIWAISAFVDIRLDITQREIEQSVLLNKRLDAMSQEIQVVSNYFSLLSQKQKTP